MVMMIIIIHIKHQQQKIRRLMTITIYCTINIIIIIRSVLTIIIIIIFFKISNGNTCKTEWSPIQSVITRAFKKITRPFDLIITSTLTDNQFCDWWI